MLTALALGLPGVAAAQGEPGAAHEVRADAKEQPADAAPAPPELGDMQRVAAQLGEALVAAQAHLGEALAAAQARLEEMRAAAQAAAERLRAQLRAASREKDRAAARLAESERGLVALAGEHKEAQARIANLTGAAEQAKMTITQLNEDLVLARDKIALANSSRSDAEARLVETQKALDGARSEATRVGEELTASRARLAAADAALAEARAERDSARSEIDLVRAEVAALLRSIIAELQPEGGADVPSDEPGDGGALDSPEVSEMAAATFEAARDANIRSSPNAKSKRIAWVKKGETVLVTGHVVGSNWYRIDSGEGESGYVFADLLRRQPQATPVTALRSSFPAQPLPLELKGPAVPLGETAGEMSQECLVCPPLVSLAAGSFAVGTGPGQQVAIDQPFAIGKYEVTVTEWLACVEAGGCEYLPETAGAPPTLRCATSAGTTPRNTSPG